MQRMLKQERKERQEEKSLSSQLTALQEQRERVVLRPPALQLPLGHISAVSPGGKHKKSVGENGEWRANPNSI